MTTPMLRLSRFILVVSTIVSLFVVQTPVFASQQTSSAAASQQASQSTAGSSPSQNSQPAASTPESSSTLPDAPQPAQSQSNSRASGSQEQQAPAGAAAAKAPRVQGAPASEPVGAAIAPAKQSQRRSLWIKVGLVAGAGIALGTALALSKGSPSRPPGAQAASTHP